MNPYLIRLRAMRHPEKRLLQEPAKPSKPLPEIAAATSDERFEGFEGDREGHFLKIYCACEDEDAAAKNPKNSTTAYPQNLQNQPNGVGARVSLIEVRGGRPPLLGRTFAALEARCPEYVDRDRWQQCITDGRAFLTTWGSQAEALGWDARSLFGLHKPPDLPHPSYRRLSRYDATGLVWLLEGREVVALTEATATIRNPTTGTITTYRRHLKPALGRWAIRSKTSLHEQVMSARVFDTVVENAWNWQLYRKLAKSLSALWLKAPPWKGGVCSM
jgi:hypothetical protein